MISVNELYKTVEDIAVKDQHGNFNNDEFNRILVSAQNDIMNFFIQKDGESIYVNDALQPFLKTTESAITYPISLPADYRSKRSLGVRITTTANGSTTFDWLPVDFQKNDEYENAQYNSIRQPSANQERFIYKIDENGISILPTLTTGRYRFTYYRHPAVAVRGVTVDAVNEIEIYDAGATTDLEWPQSYFNYFRDVVCYYLGINIRESEIVQWLSAKRVKHE